MTTPLVSVIMPVYNSGPYVREAIESVLNQSYLNWELLIVNDGSTDGSDQVIKSFSDERIRLFTQINKGVSSARNVALSAMKGEFFCFLDADDILPRDSIRSRLIVFQNSDEIHFVDGVVKQYDQELKTLLGMWRPSFTGQPMRKLLRLSPQCFYGLTWMIRRNSTKDYTFLSGMTNAEDILFYINIAERGNYAFTQEDVLYNRRWPFSASTNLDGLASGYRLLFTKVKGKLSFYEWWYLNLRIRRIMFLSYLSQYQIVKACWFALLRKL